MVLKDHQSLEDIHTKVITEFSKTLEMFGLTPAEARLFVTIYIHPHPMTLDEMSQALGKSKTSMSTGVRSLIDQGLVNRVWKKGVRKDLFQANKSIYKNFMSSYIRKWQTAANEQETNLKKVENQLKNRYREFSSEKQMEDADLLYQRLEQMIGFHENILKTFHKLDPE
ncbi:transcriptional regulator [Halobacillus halophilus]|uniref:HTH-type transcriptional regulator n=1 Tax=Halobacillus halophilus (strain ATCC 35676 / DSM 2266 / JCM 20832 / KCTC 3685 / LMG 17431 / NBRC 102448 / NCIMB 2269) TaxID=866895 RepID=I0JK90_HALH3|nr:MarR family transcriptional regulator [Halobacillus halophilus]ASF38708.1 transcriptional regulator [Halobacillus halophilus]CCG44559.1 YuaC family transcription regulator [Halobacillus halophilus DSM 2266]